MARFTPTCQDVRPPASLRLPGVRMLCVLLGCLALRLTGCSEQPLEFREVKRVDEKVTRAELEEFLQVIESLPEQRLPKLPPVFAPPPQWNASRTLSVSELVNEERTVLEDHWSVEQLSRRLQRNRQLQRALRVHRMTPEQFVGMALAVGLSLSRTTLREEQDLQQVLEQGNRAIAALRDDQRSFNSLDQELMFYVLRQAAWLTRVDRARRLILVPPENVALATEYHDQLIKIFPEEFTTNPLDSIADLLEERGMPFEVLPSSPDDDSLDWNPEEVVFGSDPPDDLLEQSTPAASGRQANRQRANNR